MGGWTATILYRNNKEVKEVAVGSDSLYPVFNRYVKKLNTNQTLVHKI